MSTNVGYEGSDQDPGSEDETELGSDPQTGANEPQKWSPEPQKRAPEDVTTRGGPELAPRDVHIKVQDPDEDHPGEESRTTFIWCLLVFVLVLLITVVVLALALLTRGFGTWSPRAPPRVCQTSGCVSASAAITSNLDPDADPCEDFYQYVCGGYERQNVLSSSESSRNAFTTLGHELKIKMKAILEEPSKLDDLNAVKQMRTLYKSCMDVGTIDKLGVTALQKLVNDKGGWPIADPTWKDEDFKLEEYAPKVGGGVGIIQYGPNIDAATSIKIMLIKQSPLLIPNAMVYMNAQFLAVYEQTLVKLAIAFGIDATTAADGMRKVVELEKKLARISTPPGMATDPANIAMMTVKDANEQIAGIDILTLLNNVLTIVNKSLTNDDKITVFDLEYFKKLGPILKETEPKIIATYILVQGVVQVLPYLDYKTRSVFEDLLKALTGASAGQETRYLTCTDTVNQFYPLVLARLYADKHLKGGLDDIEELMDEIKNTFKDRLDDQDWLDGESRDYASLKVDTMRLKLGYPKWITDNDKLETVTNITDLRDNAYLHNIIAITEETTIGFLKDVNQVVDRFEWVFPAPLTVNAFYSPNENAMIFPIGIFAPPFYYPDGSRALNYGSIGKVIGHEITHGFDSKGRYYDKDGNIRNWMTSSSTDNFNNKVKCIEAQYSDIIIKQLGIPVDGKLTLSENIADIGGIRQSFQAYRHSVERHGQDLPLPGLNMTGDQVYFIGFGQLYCSVTSQQALIMLAQTDVHTPNRERIIGGLRNSDDFSRAFNCPRGSTMNPEEKCQIW